MDESTLAIVLVWFMVFIYSILGSIDFGAGFWGMVYGRNEATNAGALANRFLSPTWEVTNTFLVLVVVALVGFFPTAIALLGTALLLPVSLVLFLLLIRSSFMVYAYSSQKYGRMLRVVSGITGLLIPALLLSILPITLGGFIDIVDEVPYLYFGRLLANPTEWAHLGFGISTELFLSSLFLADYSNESKDDSSYRLYRKAAIWLGPFTLFFAVITTYTMVPSAQWIVNGILGQGLWYTLSFLTFIVGYSALWWKTEPDKVGIPRLAFTAIIIQYAFASIGYGIAHMPYLIYPYLTVAEGFTNTATFHALLISYVIGLMILGPAFYLFWKLFLKDKRYLRNE
ncbi:cytochrome bd-I ubiquinol oxidase subunit 2 apoprotein [Paenibacillus sp. 1_12]|uniref:cytochrome d ubiquinol oxidase subunit II n=1 Tax=Paenibacillus sp. 1_12 TaxID=1566278 RepID=UPI0008E6ED3A|nr:cytochrome d ubiquinol oxidase subunit II [Paenibacillus sp. 1_12]SFM26550.1 cytochrome bd-I ubiquinol oxidase subunit 2 apoprotein [Paenibacillus sp. 1_12]